MAKPETLDMIASLQSSLAQLQIQKTAEDAAEAELVAKANAVPASTRVKSLAIELHALLCTAPHDGSGGACKWKMTADYDDAALAEWTEKEHALWLQRARSGIQSMKDLGFTVTDP